jgi:hypothetical protein
VATVGALEALFPNVIMPTGEDYYDLQAGYYWLQRVDIAYMYRLPKGVEPDAWISAAEHGIKYRGKRPTRTGGTLYFQQNSSQRSLEMYGKGRELSANPPPTHLPMREQLFDYAQNKLRLEVVVRAPDLRKRHRNTGHAWTAATGSELFSAYSGRLEVLGSLVPTEELERQLTSAEIRVYRLHQLGGNVRTAYKSRDSLHRLRKRFAGLGVDIMAPVTTPPIKVDLKSVLAARCAGVPEFAQREPQLLLGAADWVDATAGPTPRATTRIFVRSALTSASNSAAHAPRSPSQI